MENVFIGWSGNRPLADALASVMNQKGRFKAIVGGGHPKDMFIGAQVINQINQCSLAILLIEDKNGQISPNLMFEWGYVVAKLPANGIQSVLINKSPNELPSDLLGSWVSEFRFDRSSKSEADAACEIYDAFVCHVESNVKRNYFDIIVNWKHIFIQLLDGSVRSEQELCEDIIFGCLASYYYMDNPSLRKKLESISGSETLNEVVFFSKSYVDVFLYSQNMTRPLTSESFFKFVQDFEMIFSRKRKMTEELDMFLDILCYDVYGLACCLYLKNEGIDADTVGFCAEKARDCFEKVLSLVDEFKEKFNPHECLVRLISSYMYNDIAHLYKNSFNDKAKFIEYLALSVEERKGLYQSFVALYPANYFLATKFEQEYMVALSEQCDYMENPFLKNMTKNTIISKFNEWEKELIYTSSLTDRIKANLDRLK